MLEAIEIQDQREEIECQDFDEDEKVYEYKENAFFLLKYNNKPKTIRFRKQKTK